MLIAALSSMLFLSKCSKKINKPLFANAGAYPPKSGADTIDVAIEISPLGFSLSGDSVSGLDYEIINSICNQHGIAVKFHPFAPLQWAMNGLEQGYFDVLISSLQSTSALKEKLTLTHAVYIDRQVLVQRKNNKKFITSPDELGGDTVWIAKGSPSRQRILNLASEIGDTIYIIDDAALTPEHLIMLTATGKVPRAVVPRGVAANLGRVYPDIDISTPISFNQFQAWGVASANTDFATTLNRWIDDFSTTEEYKRLIEKYLQKQ